ncbi:MAG: protein kinase [Actinobacteria bacterium]|uniref:Unannotated protein n=1 Tax=freshwater metagenome TaxID=449393 RepID=A0A6J7E7Z0_9ZZZZ|nr:protein kinase [Actinomycetota bacterium]
MSDNQDLIAGRYEAGRRLGGSAGADVVAARDTHLQRSVALKVLRPESRGDTGALERLRRSAQSTGAVSSPNVVDVYDWSADADLAYMAMEIVNGGTLAESLRSHGPLPANRAVSIASGVASGLVAIHAASQVHGAITTDSVLLTRDGSPRLTALSGGPSAASNADEARNFAGVCSPEVLGGSSADAASDVWALGVVLYESITGARPFDGADTVAVATSVMRDTPVAPSQRAVGVPFVLDNLILRMLSRDPATRITTAAVALSELTMVTSSLAATATVANPVAAPRTEALPVTGQVTAGAAAAAAGVGASNVGGDAVEPSRPWLVPVLIAIVIGLGGLLGWTLFGPKDSNKTPAEMVTVPDVIDETSDTASNSLFEAGLRGIPQEKSSETVKVGIVFAQQPQPGTKVERSTKVRYSVSTGPATTTTSSTTTSSTSSTTSSSTTSSTSTTTTTIPPTTTT